MFPFSGLHTAAPDDAIVYPFSKRLGGNRSCAASVFSLSRTVLIIASCLHFVTFLLFLFLSLFVAGGGFTLAVTITQFDFVLGVYVTDTVIAAVPGFVYPGIFTLLSCLEHLVQVVKYKWFMSRIAAGQNELKWLFYGFSAPWMSTGTLHLAGCTEFFVLAAVWVLTSITMAFGYAVDNVSRRDHPKARKWLFWIGWVPVIWAWITILVYTHRAPNVPGFVYAVVWTLFVMFNTFGISMALLVYDIYTPDPDPPMSRFTVANASEPDQTEPVRYARAYARYTVIDVWLSYIAKILLPAIVFGGVLRP